MKEILLAFAIVAIGIGIFSFIIILSCCVAAGEADDEMEQIVKSYKEKDFK